MFECCPATTTLFCFSLLQIHYFNVLIIFVLHMLGDKVTVVLFESCKCFVAWF